MIRALSIRWIFVLFAVVAAVALPSDARAKKLALIVGNDLYDALPDLQKARSDARGYQEHFAGLGFQATLIEDANRRDMVATLARFYDTIDPGDTVVFVYSGHGWSNGRENFLVPTDTPGQGSESFITAESIALRNGANGIIDEIKRRGPRLTVAIIDACRDNPFQVTQPTRSLGLSRGLAAVNAPEGTFVAFSAGAGQAALDRLSNDDPSPYSVFTRVFLEELGKAQDIQTAFKSTQRTVYASAQSVGHSQRPAYYDEVIGSACLQERCSTGAAVAVQTTPQTPSEAAPNREEVASQQWAFFKDTDSIAALELFARTHSGTAFAALAQDRIAVLRQEGQHSTQPQAQTQLPVIPTPQPEVPAPRSLTEIVRDIQGELQRLSCQPGNLDGTWSEATTAAANRFIIATGTTLDEADIRNGRFLETLQQTTGPVCTAQWVMTQAPWAMMGVWTINTVCWQNGQQVQASGQVNVQNADYSGMYGTVVYQNGYSGQFQAQNQGQVIQLAAVWSDGAQSYGTMTPSANAMQLDGQDAQGCQFAIFR